MDFENMSKLAKRMELVQRLVKEINEFNELKNNKYALCAYTKKDIHWGGSRVQMITISGQESLQFIDDWCDKQIEKRVKEIEAMDLGIKVTVE